MANILDGLLDRLTDAGLKAAIRAEVERLRSTKEFGLVFERHLPESVLLHSCPVRTGAIVRLRERASRDEFRVKRVNGESAVLIDREGRESQQPLTDLVVVRSFGETIYPGMRSLGRIERGGDKPCHLVISGENHHVLETLTFTSEGAIDCIYIDPPYNTGARDWKYNNDYVDATDSFRHSKWLSFMEKRLRLAKRLLNPEGSVLLVTIDDNELCTLGLLLEQIFPECERQIVSITISPRGKSRDGRLSQVDEYLLVLYVGAATVSTLTGDGEPEEIRWRGLRRTDIESARGTKKGGPRQFYPIYVDTKTSRIVAIGEPLRPDQLTRAAPRVPGATAVFPIRPDGQEMNWSLVPESLKRTLDQGYVRVTCGGPSGEAVTFSYLTHPTIKKIESGEYELRGVRDDGSKIVVIPRGKVTRPTTAWRDARFDAGAYGTALLRALLPGRKFPFPKSLYAVEEALRVFIGDKPHARVLDFFGGSGTTTHAVMRLNLADGGSRQSILVTNNEVSEDEAKQLAARGLRTGDPEWDAHGVFQHVTMPRVTAAVTGLTPEGAPVSGTYNDTEERAISEGLPENVEFLELSYLDRNGLARGAAFDAIAPLLWARAGAQGPLVTHSKRKFSLPAGASYGVLFDVASWRPFVDSLDERPDVHLAYIVTDSLAQFQQISAELPARVRAAMLYEDYLRNFEIVVGRAR